MATKKAPSREEFAAGMKKAAEETQKEIAKKTEEVKEVAKETAKKTTTTAKKAAAKTATTAKKTATKTAAAAKKTATKTATAAKKKVAEKTAEVEVAAILQFAGRDFKVEDIVKQAEEAYKAENKKALKSIRVYIKPEDGAAYYVANDDYAGRIDL